MDYGLGGEDCSFAPSFVTWYYRIFLLLTREITQTFALVGNRVRRVTWCGRGFIVVLAIDMEG
jgi:hypothetical protein